MSQFEYDLLIVGAGVGGHGAALHAVACGLKTAIVESAEMGGTCVNRGCIPSKALLAASGKVRELQNAAHLKSMGIALTGPIAFDRQTIADHANSIVTKQREGLTGSLKRLNVDVIHGFGRVTAPQQVTVKTETGDRVITAKDIILATGSVPFVPPGSEIDGKTVFTSDHAVKLDSLPDWIAIIGSGYIGLEFADVYTALGCEVTMIEALDQLMPTFDPDIAKVAQRSLLTARDIETKTGVFATKIIPGSPVLIELTDAKTKEVVDTLEVDACLIATGRVPATKDMGLEGIGVTLNRGFIPVDDYLRVMAGEAPVPHLWAIGDATGKYMLAHAASAQGVAVVETICERPRTIDYNCIPAAAFTHPEVSFVGVTEPKAKEQGAAGGYPVSSVKTYFKGNAKALAEGETDGMAKVIFRPDTGEILGVHIFGLHAADLIQEAANAMVQKVTVKELAFSVHTHPTLCEVLDEAFKRAAGAGAGH